MNAHQRWLTERLRAPGTTDMWVAVRMALLDHGLDPCGVVVAEMTDGGPETFGDVEMETYDGVVVTALGGRVYRIQVGRDWNKRGSWTTCRWCDLTEQWRERAGFARQIEAALARIDAMLRDDELSGGAPTG